MIAGNDFIGGGDRRFRFIITISNAHLCPPRARSRLLVLLHRVVPVRGSREVASQVWALLFSLFLFRLLLDSYSRDASPSNLERFVCAFASILILIQVRRDFPSGFKRLVPSRLSRFTLGSISSPGIIILVPSFLVSKWLFGNIVIFLIGVSMTFTNGTYFMHDRVC